jgi:hypothetical protein
MPDDKKPDEKPGDDKNKGAPEVEALRAELSTVQQRLKEVTEESIGRRKELAELKPLKALFDGMRQTLGVEGDAAAVEAKVKEVSEQGKSKLRSILLRSEVTAAAAKAGMRDPSDAARMLDLADLQVDVDKETVDQKTLGERLQGLKTSKPYLFGDGTPLKPDDKTAPPAGTQDPGKPDLGGKGSAYEQWTAARKAGDTKKAAEIYLKHRDEIGRAVAAGGR